MKFNCGLSYESMMLKKRRAAHVKATRLEQWHRTFLWIPVRFSDTECRWLEFAVRRATSCYIGRDFSFFASLVNTDYRPKSFYVTVESYEYRESQ